MKTVCEVLGLKRVKGEVGIEIEIEGAEKGFPHTDQWWKPTSDGSLRDGIEFVLREPVARDDVIDAMAHLKDEYKRVGGRPKFTERCSTHVHINVQDLTPTQLFNFITLYLIVEKCLIHWCAEEREGNLFCLRACDAEYLVDCLERVAYGEQLFRLSTDALRYAAMNVNAITKYGSLEFRSLQGTLDVDLLMTWVDALLQLKEASKTFNNPRGIIEGFSEGGEGVFVQQFMGDLFQYFFNYPDWEQDVYEGVRMAQQVAYAHLPASKVPKKKPASKKYYTESNEALRRMYRRDLPDNSLVRRVTIAEMKRKRDGSVAERQPLRHQPDHRLEQWAAEILMDQERAERAERLNALIGGGTRRTATLPIG